MRPGILHSARRPLRIASAVALAVCLLLWAATMARYHVVMFRLSGESGVGVGTGGHRVVFGYVRDSLQPPTRWSFRSMPQFPIPSWFKAELSGPDPHVLMPWAVPAALSAGVLALTWRRRKAEPAAFEVLPLADRTVP